MKKKTILFYINSLVHGGAERVIVQLADHFADAGYRAVIITSYFAEDEYTLPASVERISIDAKRDTGTLFSRNVRRVMAVRRICKEYCPEAIISFMSSPNLRSIIATAGLNVKTIISVRSDPSKEYEGIVWKLIAKLILPCSDGCVFQTEQAKSWFPARLQKKSAIIFNEVGRDFFSTEYVGGGDVVALGRLEEVKNFSFLIDAFAKIADKVPTKSLLIYGEGKMRSELEEHITNRHMHGRAQIMGVSEHPESVLKNAGLFVLSSNYEGMPNALLEALAVGTPCISTDCPCGGPRMVIKNGENGLLVPVKDVNAMADAILRVLMNPMLAEMLGKNARASSERFRPDVIFEQWKSYVESVVGK